MTLGSDGNASLWRQGLWLGLAWGAVEVGTCRWVAPLPHLPALAEMALTVLFWTLFAGLLSLALRPWGARGRAAGPMLLISFFFSVTTNLLVHPFLFSGVLLLSRTGLLYALWFIALLLVPALVALIATRGSWRTLSPAGAVLAAVLMGIAFAVGRTQLPAWPIGLGRVYAAIALAGLAETLALVLVIWTARIPWTTRPALAAALLVILICPAPWSMRDPLRHAHEATAPDDAPPVVLISLDTARPDHLSYYGYPLSTSPNLDRLLATCRVFPVAYATAPWTVPSHASVFTGLHPRSHGAHYMPGGAAGSPPQPMDPRPGTLAEHFRDQGYATAAIAANSLSVSPWLGMDRGFQLVSDGHRLPERPIPLNLLRGTAQVLRNRSFWRFARMHYDGMDITKQAGAWVRRNQDQPFFLFVNYLDPHRPYAPPISALTAYDQMSAKDRLAWSLKRIPRNVSHPEDYDGELRHMDAALGGFLDALETTGLLDRAILVVFSDHGEFFGEMGLTGHGREVHEAVLRAVLAVRSPGGENAGVDSTLATIADVPSLLMDCLQGRIPRPAESDQPRILGEIYLTRHNMRRAPRFGDSPRLVAVREGDYKLIDHGDGHALFNIVTDPQEEIDLAASQPEVAGRLLAFLREWEASAELPAPDDEGRKKDELRETLKGLGYFQ